MTLTYASTFTGIGGFEIALDELGARATYMVEKAAAKMALLNFHWPTVKKGRDIRDTDAREIGNPDLIVGGFPCKHISRGRAGRKGIAEGTESGLYWEFQRLVAEHLRLVDAARPRWAVLENVADLLTFNGGRDMAAVVLGLESLGYGWAYRVVDCRVFGSAQRRERVIIVAHRGGDPRPAFQVLADPATGLGNTGLRLEPSREITPRRDYLPEGIRLFRKSANPVGTAATGAYASYVEQDYFNCLTSNDSGSNPRQKHLVHQDGRLRALTPLEWERLQGFPDGWTSMMPESTRFKALGDAMNVDAARWLFRRLISVHESMPLLPNVA